MKKMFLMAVAALMATMTFAQAWEWKQLTAPIKPTDFVNVTQEDAAAQKNPECFYVFHDNGDGKCQFLYNDMVVEEWWNRLELLSYIAFYPAAKPKPEAIDLGLSVNWANFNLGASAPEETGDYYGWGETTTKEEYSEYTYTYSDNPTVLPASADAATQILGGNWRIPTKEEIQELINECSWANEKENGMNGFRITSKKVGYTDKSIFLPAAGYYEYEQTSIGYVGNYWASTIDENADDYAYYLYFTNTYSLSTGDRYYGTSIRPVCTKPSTPTALENTNADTNADRKVMRNGQLLIIRDGVTYDAQGAIVK